MTDTVSKIRRSEIMSSIKSSNTQPELIVRKFLFNCGFRYRLKNNLPGKPDIKLAKYGVLIFVNGCFWHGHKNCNKYVMPKSNRKFWENKITQNVKRDKKTRALLRRNKWTVFTVWECQLKPQKREKTLEKLLLNILAISC